ncbi:MAG TPA: glutamine--fructose-6-phosphate transaminase (isomerizing) [Sedimentisphaerales bacterium]|nr:glutamine--fructose-6-phosphate transaminase (isomerizing) [Sedimentisphaerales bacterium]HRS12125.1 glutamine--fructose-6-phosphate transaminase (isomerizing) [Sedimentisphaerales bacterium]HRV48723.1 glutamine--fructose-6-phosphate transaminase (isomerizing) [Sedimentisphaerales bacterium]
MCGIVAYLGRKAAQPILVEGLKRLEYRGYDSAGLAVLDDGSIRVTKTRGRISALEEILDEPRPCDTVGIAHTRWATHGQPNTVNAHPHLDWNGKIAVVHNGIIENYATLRTWLQNEGVTFRSETDTEVIANLIGYIYADTSDTGLADGRNAFEWAVQQALRKLHGTFGLAVLCADFPDTLIGAKRGSPLILGVGDAEYILASDAAAIVEHTTQAIYMADNEMVLVGPDGFHTKTIDNVTVAKDLKQIEFSLEQIELGGFEHHMLKEIFEQPESLRTCMGGRIELQEGRIKLGGIRDYLRQLTRARHVIFTACGTAFHAGLVGEFLLEHLARIPVSTEYASEFRYRNPIIEDGTIVIAISQSGETADTLAAVEQAKERGAIVLGVVNVVGSTIARATDAGIYLHVGPEIGVASTKAFTAQVAVLSMLAIELGRRRHLGSEDATRYVAQLAQIPEKIETILEQSDHIREIAAANIDKENWLFLGRGFNYPVALEGALKLKEISYIHAEGLPAAEMKHGPIALIADGMPAVFLATAGPQYDKMMGNIQEVRARGGRIIAVATEGDEYLRSVADHLITVPPTPELFQPLLTVVPLQLLAYHAAVLRGHDVDKPRNLAKSVTVE